MKRIIYILIISALCLTGCQNKAKDINIIETWKTGSLQKDFYKKDFDKPSKEDEDNEIIKLKRTAEGSKRKSFIILAIKRSSVL